MTYMPCHDIHATDTATYTCMIRLFPVSHGVIAVSFRPFPFPSAEPRIVDVAGTPPSRRRHRVRITALAMPRARGDARTMSLATVYIR